MCYISRPFFVWMLLVYMPVIEFGGGCRGKGTGVAALATDWCDCGFRFIDCGFIGCDCG